VTSFASSVCYIDIHQYNKDTPAKAIYCNPKGLLWPRFRHSPHDGSSIGTCPRICGALWPHSPQVV